MSGLSRGEYERRQRRELGMEDHWDDPGNPDYADTSRDDEMFRRNGPPVDLVKAKDRCRRRRNNGFTSTSWGPCWGVYVDGRCDKCKGVRREGDR